MTAKNTYILPRTEVLPIRLENSILTLSDPFAPEGGEQPDGW